MRVPGRVRTLYESVAMAPDGVGAGDEQQRQIPEPKRGDGVDLDIFDPMDEISDESGGNAIKALREMFGGGEDDDDDDEQQPKKPKDNPNPDDDEIDDDEDPANHNRPLTKKQQQEMQQAMADGIVNSIKGFKLSDDLIPDDFDGSDMKQLRALLTRTSQQSMLQTIQMIFKPMQASQDAFAREIRAEMARNIKTAGASNKIESALETLVPEIHDKAIAPTVRGLHKLALEKHKNDATKAARMVRTALDAMGIKSKGGKTNASDPSGAGFRQGVSALDRFAPTNK